MAQGDPLTQDDYERLCSDIIAGRRGGHPIAPDGVTYIRQRQPLTFEDTLLVTITYADGTASESLHFSSSNGVTLHPIGA
jgi:hypothetical protein